MNISAFEGIGEYHLRPMGLFDVTPVVRIHMLSFVNFFLTFLGPAFVKELYKSTITDQSGIAIVAESDGVMYGFVTGTVAASEAFIVGSSCNGGGGLDWPALLR